MLHEHEVILAFGFLVLAVFLAGVNPSAAPVVLMGIGVLYLITVSVLDIVIKRTAQKRREQCSR